MYGKSWACPPAVGPVRECQERCKSYSGALLITMVSEVQDISDLEETLATRAPHEEVTRQASHVLKEEAEGVSVLSTESCAFCQACTYPEGKPCRHPERMFPCVESCGFIATDIAEQYGIEYFTENIDPWFSILFYR